MVKKRGGHFEVLMKKKLLLASGSPRRRALLSMAGFEFEWRSVDVDEEQLEKRIEESLTYTSQYELAEASVLELARAKAHAAAYEGIVLAADTVVVTEETMLGKPRDAKDAREILRSLCGRIHRVYTGVCILTGKQEESFSECTEVEFFPLDEIAESMIDRYVGSGAPMDKAGAYGIQDQGGLLVKSIRGDYFNVVGLPVARVARSLYRYLEIK